MFISATKQIKKKKTNNNIILNTISYHVQKKRERGKI